MKFSNVVGYHMNPERCGVARFNAELAARLGVPFVGLKDQWGLHPLFSLKWSELDLRAQLACLDRTKAAYSVFWHDEGCPEFSHDAQYVISGVTELWCPPLVRVVSLSTVDVTLFTFGMGSKIQTEPYRKIRQLLEAAGLSFRLKVSVALHEGTSLESVSMHFDALDQVLGSTHVQVLGCLSDSALAEQMQAADVICAFFPTGVRANNTSIHAAMAMGKPVVTNLDDRSPRPLQGVVFNIHRLTTWPTRAECRQMALNGCLIHHRYYTWERFMSQLEGLSCAS